MNPASAVELMPPANPDASRRVREVLDRAGYSSQGITKALDLPDLNAVRPGGGEMPRLFHRTAGGTPLDTLLRLFFFDLPADIEAVQSAVAPMTPEEWQALGLLEPDGNGVRTTFTLRPFEQLLLASDWPKNRHRRNHVTGFGATSQQLAQLTLRWPSRRTLDLGTGNGVQALLAAAHSTEVLAVDLNPRALRFAAFNAQLNGVERMTCAEGNFFEPAGGQRFDLIVSNPPFVIGPESRYLYRDSGMRADHLCECIVRAAPSYLNEGGVCQLLCNVASIGGQSWQGRLAEWLTDSGCDAWVLHLRTAEPARYASHWIADAEGEEAAPDELARQFDAWLSYYERERIESIAFALVTLRKAPAGRPTWFRCEECPPLVGPCGAAIEQGMALRDFLEAVRDDRTLLSARLRLAPQVQWEQQLVPGREGWALAVSRFRLPAGLAYSGAIDANTFALADRCRGRLTVSEALAEVAAARRLDLAAATGPALAVIRRLVEQAILLPQA
jgi:SAM-dependent methyltransferase